MKSASNLASICVAPGLNTVPILNVGWRVYLKGRFDITCVFFRTELVPRELVEACKIKETTRV